MHAWKPIRGSIDSFCPVSLWSATAGQKSVAGQPSVTNVLPPEGRRWWGGTGGTGSRPWDAVPLIIGGQSVRGDTPRAFSPPPPSLCPVHGKLIRGNAGKDDRPEADRACPPRCPDRFADRIKGERKWIGLRSILGFLTFSKILHRRIRETIHWWDCNWS